MARLTYKERKNLPSSTFVEPGKRKYPIPDAAHGRNALARVSQHGSPAEKAKVRAAVHRKFPGIGKGEPEAGETMKHERGESKAKEKSEHFAKPTKKPGGGDTGATIPGQSVAKAPKPAGHDTAKGDKFNTSYVKGGPARGGFTGHAIPGQSLYSGSRKGGRTPKSPSHIRGD